MTSRVLAAVLLLLGSAVAVSTLPAADPSSGTAVDASALPFPSDLHVLSEDPVKLVKVGFDKEKQQASFVLEFTRDLTVLDADWAGVLQRPPLRFEFEDADRATLMSLAAVYEGVPIGLKGRRVRIVLQFPSNPDREGQRVEFLKRTKRIVVDPKRYGDLSELE
jgi:hypothetical protein